MGYRTLQECVRDLERTGQLVRIEQEIDAHLEAAEIHRRVFRSGGPAIYFARVKGCRFPMLSNLFGTIERTRFLFRDTLDVVRQLVELKVDPAAFWKNPWRYRRVPRAAWNTRVRRVRRGSVLENVTSVSQLPHLQSWPMDGGAFITLPQVYTEDVERPGFGRSNLGMYRVQLSGGEYASDSEVGLHYQIHRGIGVHHAAARRRGVPFRVNVFVGGPPCMTVAAVMPLPEGLSELHFAGALGGRRVAMICREGQLPVAAEADFCLSGTVDPHRLLPEGPFGDHLGYYSLAHPFPVLRVDRVTHSSGAIWPFTVVGRPPQEDTQFGQFIHELTGPIIPTVIPGVEAVHAVDATGVHPLLLAIGRERYLPFAERRRPMELLTQANAILGQGQLSLAKYLLIVNRDDDPALDIHDLEQFFRHVLSRVDWSRDLHFQTRTTIDTLDYSGGTLNEGSKVVIAAAGPPVRELATEVPPGLKLPTGFTEARLAMPGVLTVCGPGFPKNGQPGHVENLPQGDTEPSLAILSRTLSGQPALDRVPLIVLVDDSQFASRTLSNFLWVTFTRSNPAADIWGVSPFVHQKHWGCRGPLIVDARVKPHHAPPLLEDPDISRRVDALGAPGGPLHGLF